MNQWLILYMMDMIDNKQGTTIRRSSWGATNYVHCAVITRVSSTRRGNINRVFIHNK